MPHPQDGGGGTTAAWKVIFPWFAAAIAIFAVIGQWGIVLFALVYGGVFGGMAYRLRRGPKPLFKALRLDNYGGFVLLMALITPSEEMFCYSLGCNLAQPVLWVDLLWVTAVWLVRSSVWYLYVARRYAFGETEALLVASLAGIVFELEVSGLIVRNPLAALVLAPLAIVTYAATFVLPLQLMDLSGTDHSRWRYVVGVAAPSGLATGVALPLWAILVWWGVPLV